MNPRRRFLVFGAGAVAGCGGAAGGASIAGTTQQAAPPAAPPGAGRALPGAFQLFGPVQRDAALRYPLPVDWEFPGSALTPNSKLIRFDLGVPKVLWAIWRICWTTKSTDQMARLVHFDDGPQNIVPLGLPIIGTARGEPDNQPLDITSAFNALRGGPYKNIGLQLCGNGTDDFYLFESRIEIAWELP